MYSLVEGRVAGVTQLTEGSQVLLSGVGVKLIPTQEGAYTWSMTDV